MHSFCGFLYVVVSAEWYISAWRALSVAFPTVADSGWRGGWPGPTGVLSITDGRCRLPAGASSRFNALCFHQIKTRQYITLTLIFSMSFEH